MKIKLNSQNEYNNLAQKIAETIAGSWTFEGKENVLLALEELEEFTSFDMHHIQLENGIDWFIVRHKSPKETFLTIKLNRPIENCYFLIEIIDKSFYPDCEIEDRYSLEDYPEPKRKKLKNIHDKAIKEIVNISNEVDIKSLSTTE